MTFKHISAIKWGGVVSDRFQIDQGVRQGGVLSADLYTLYVDPALHLINDAGIGARIGNIACAAPTCADDMLVASMERVEVQVMVSAAGGFSQQRRYKIQPEKSLVIDGEDDHETGTLQLLRKDMPKVKSAMHLVIQRSVSGTVTMEETVNNNIQKARRTCYSLMPAYLHGHNGLDPATCVHLLKL